MCIYLIVKVFNVRKQSDQPDTESVLEVTHAHPFQASVVFFWLQRYAVSQCRVPRHIHDVSVIVGLYKGIPPTIQYKLAADRCKCGRITCRWASALVQRRILPLQLLCVQHEEVIQRLQAAFYPAATRVSPSSESTDSGFSSSTWTRRGIVPTKSNTHCPACFPSRKCSPCSTCADDS